MTFDDLKPLLESTGIPFAYHHWEKPPKPPFGVYLSTGTDNFGADDKTWAVVEGAAIELYTVGRDRESMTKIERALDSAEIYWDRDTVYIEELRLYQTRYEIEV